MIAWTAAGYLFGLLGIVVPIIIHLWSKQAAKTIPFGSLRFLQDTETRTMKSLLPTQWLLLLLRCLMLTTLVFILAKPLLPKTQAEQIREAYLIDPVLQKHPWLNVFFDTVKSENVYWMAEGFPKMDSEVQAFTSMDFFQLLESPPSLNTSGWIVVSPLEKSSFKGEQIDFPISYQWLKPPTNPEVSTYLDYKKDGTSQRLDVIKDEWLTQFAMEEVSSAEKLTVRYRMRADQAYAEHKGIFQSALDVLQELSPISLEEVQDEEDADWIIWFSDEEIQTIKPIIKIDLMSLSAWNRLSPEYIEIGASLSEEEALAINLPLRLLRTFMETATPELADKLTVDQRMFRYELDTESRSEIRVGLENWLWILLLFLFLGERLLSFKTSKA